MVRTARWLAWGLGLVMPGLANAQVIEAPWQPVNPAMAPVRLEEQGGRAPSRADALPTQANVHANGPQVSVSQKPFDNGVTAAPSGSSPYYRTSPTLAPSLVAPNYGWAGNTWAQPTTGNTTTAWWDGNQWVAGAQNQPVPMPNKFPAIIASSPVQAAPGYPYGNYQNYAVQQPTVTVNAPGVQVGVAAGSAALPAAPAGFVQQPGAPLRQSTAPIAPPPMQPNVALQTQIPASPRPSAPFVDETVFTPGGQSWREYDIAPYTGRFLPEDRPEHAVRRWLLAQTGGPGAWFGHETTALKISRDRVQVYQTPEMQARIADVLGRFLYFTPGRFRCRARVYNLAHVKAWRGEFQPRLLPAGARSPGRQAWLMDPADANRFVNKYDNQNGGYLLGDQRFVVGNGQDATVTVPLSSKSYVRDVIVDSGYRAGEYTSASYRPQSEEIEDGVRLRISPLIASDAATIELDVQAASLKVETSKSVTLDAAGRPKVDVPAVSTALFDERIEIKPGRFVLVSLGLGPNFDPRFRLFKKEKAEIVVLLEINPESANTINGQPIPRPQTMAASSPVGTQAPLPPQSQSSFPPTALTQRLF